MVPPRMGGGILARKTWRRLGAGHGWAWRTVTGGAHTLPAMVCCSEMLRHCGRDDQVVLGDARLPMGRVSRARVRLLSIPTWLAIYYLLPLLNVLLQSSLPSLPLVHLCLSRRIRADMVVVWARGLQFPSRRPLSLLRLSQVVNCFPALRALARRLADLVPRALLLRLA